MDLRFNVCFVRLSDLTRLGHLMPHETVRGRGMLVIIDTCAHNPIP